MSFLVPLPTTATLSLAMHAPDGLFSMPVNVVFAGVVLLVLAAAVAALSRSNDHRLVPLMGIMAAFIFAGQMVNFPIAAGTTGHLLGGTLAAVLLGPWAGTLVLAAVVFFQALLGDGGITVLGPNVFNMGVVGTCLGYFVYRAALGNALAHPARVVAASFFAAWVAVVLASVFASLQLAVSGTVGLDRALLAMVGTHAIIGVGEALITASVVAFVLKTRPELLHDRQAAQTRPLGRAATLFGLSAALVVALFLSLLPTMWDHPDGLEYIGFDQGFIREEPELGPDGTLASLPAYPLGVRLENVDGHATATHQYNPEAAAIVAGDVITRIGTTSVTNLAAAAAALAFDPDAGECTVTPDTSLSVVILRDGQQQELTVQAAATPPAGGRPPMVALLPDYTVPGIDGLVTTSLAGAIGTIIMFVASFAVGRALVRPSRLVRAFADATEEPGAQVGQP